MAVSERTANVTVEGDLRLSSASIVVNGRSYGELAGTIMERLDSGNGKTSPEDLLASACAADFATTLAGALASQGSHLERLDVTARCRLDRTGEGLAITHMDVDVRARVPRLDAASFEEIVRKADEKCLVSGAMRGNVEFHLSAELLSQ